MIKHGDQNLFLGLYIDISTSIPNTIEDFMTHLREAWKSLRLEVPIIALQVYHVPVKNRPFPRPYMVYDVARSTSEVDRWAEDTVFLMEGYKDLDDLRYHIGQDPLPPTDFVPQTYVYALSKSSKSYGIPLTHLLTELESRSLAINCFTIFPTTSVIPTIRNWRRRRCDGEKNPEILYLSCWMLFKVMNRLSKTRKETLLKKIPGEIREGPAYDKTLAEVMYGLGRCSAHSHPFQSIIRPMFDVKKQNPRTRRLYYTFTLEESARIKAACAPTRSMPEKLTVNHLLHGSISLLPILDNPPKEDSNAVVFFWGLVDARTRLNPKYSRDYPGYCLAMSPIQLPVSLYDKFSHEDRRTLVLEFAKAMRDEVDMLLQGPPPPPWCGPWYSGDGRDSIYLSPTHEVDGRQILELTDFFIGLNKCEPGPFFRATEWNGRIMLSVDFNELAVETKIVQRWMDMWRDLLLAL
ncbi:hypothetical protein Clacol_002299 [Clathrus columnatus]|uniref:Uncharacterized protein n=1 Tax=Clathrus columnatus TaxID=1419009 RepID=A0AAV5A6A7_9AGAM|nr:hypothetical protein Clacol_002299 [Clathrus columnatus]